MQCIANDTYLNILILEIFSFLFNPDVNISTLQRMYPSAQADT
jgi:hypothetical protein